MPQGVVIYASNNSRLKNFAYRDLRGVLLGYRALSKGGEPLAAKAVPGQPGRKRYQVSLLTAGTVEADSAAALSKKHANDAWALGGGVAPAGTFKWEEVKTAAGVAVVRHDSSGMFAVVAADLRRTFGLAPAQVRAFQNVHDDQADGGDSADSRESFFAELKKVSASGTDFFAYSGHGSGKSLPSAGITTSHVRRLGDEIKRLVKADGDVILYACSTAAPGGFAQSLSLCLGQRRVWGHTGAGRASKNPNVRMFVSGKDQNFLEDNFSKSERTAWAGYLDRSPDFYARFPFMTVEQMKIEVGSMPRRTILPAGTATHLVGDPRIRTAIPPPR